MVEVWEQHWGQRPCFVLFLLCSGPFWPLGDILRKVGRNKDSLSHQSHRPLGNFHSVFKCASEHLKHGGGIYNNQTEAMCQLGCWQAYRMSQSSAFYCCVPGLPSYLIQGWIWRKCSRPLLPKLTAAPCALSVWDSVRGWILYIDDAVKRTKNAIFVLISTKFSPKSLIWSEAAMNPSLKLVQLCAADVSYFYSRILHHNRHILKTLKDHCVWSEWICTSFHRFVCFQYENVLSATDNT